ncbi:hypothetical protein GO013_02405 [Pseudodesulfovibrio sp. JC047]|uniref:hypothetical protein n=1 Tax=Pseudodesulfovibrio sp. JC047 TaxID=2683199 RepID=UPI0013D10BD2|nr:hypothetical protein [Pseudodesulfovibrio sp. JC047]NDV18267.1 hypothetical protein [Pseudodesulfovibrio sp. JC047]
MSKNTIKAPLMPVETLADTAKLPSWELAALRQATDWADGKQVTQSEFDTALNRLRTRPQGGGTI